jgi:hypothetical protein
VSTYQPTSGWFEFDLTMGGLGAGAYDYVKRNENLSRESGNARVTVWQQLSCHGVKCPFTPDWWIPDLIFANAVKEFQDVPLLWRVMCDRLCSNSYRYRRSTQLSSVWGYSVSQFCSVITKVQNNLKGYNNKRTMSLFVISPQYFYFKSGLKNRSYTFFS